MEPKALLTGGAEAPDARPGFFTWPHATMLGRRDACGCESRCALRFPFFRDIPGVLFSMLLRTLLVVFLTLAATLASAQSSLPPALQKAWQATKLPADALSLIVREVDGSTLLSINPDTPRNPASVMKLVTTWAALSILEPDYVWRTTLLADQDARVDAAGNLAGSVYVRAGGDPWMTVQDLWSLLRDLRLRGVTHVNDVIVDRSRFGDVSIDPGAFDDSPDRPYNASPDAMMVGLGATRILFYPNAQARQWDVIVDPPVPGLRVRGALAWSDARCAGAAHSSNATAQVNTGNGKAGALEIVLGGTVAGACGEFSLYRLVTSQSAHFAALFERLWRELGGTIGGVIRDGRTPQDARTLVWHDSRSLAEVIRLVNKQSNNVMARHVLLTLAAESDPSGTRGTTVPAAEQAALQALRAQQVDVQGWVIGNGSGLSRLGRVTAQGLGGMLQRAWASALMPEFLSSLAISGVDGTVRRRLRGDKVRGMAHLKTGSLRDVRSIAGYVLGASGKRTIVVSLVNHAQAANAQLFHDALIHWLATR